MISLAPGTKVFLACSPIDLRSGFNGLAAKAQQMIGADPFSGHLFLFRGKRGDYFKALYWDGSGLWLIAKRLEKGRFVWPPIVDGAMTLTPAQFSVLIEAMDWRRTIAPALPNSTNAGLTKHQFGIGSRSTASISVDYRMSLATADLPNDPTELRVFALACQGELKAAQTAVQLKALEIEKLKFQIAKLRRMQFGRSSERISRQIEQLEFRLEELESGEAEDVARAEAEDQPAPLRERARPKRKPLPDHLPRQDVVHQPQDDGACTCPACGKGMARLGEDVTEVLDYVPGHFQVIRHIRPKYACGACDAITQAPAPAMPTPRGRATPGTLAHLLVAKDL